MADSSSLKILVIDDEAAFADSLTKLLRRKFKAHVESVGCADAAREKMAEDFDIITLDYQMPDCDGLSLLQEISALPGAPPVIMVTGHGDEQVATEAFRLGVSGYVLKDQRMPDMLHDAIHKALIGRELSETRKQLSFQEREYKDLVESSNSIILREDVDGNITYMNKYGLDFFGYDADELVGHNIRGTIVEDVDSEGRDLAGMVDDKLADPDRFIVNENENIKKNGERVWIAWSNRSLFDADGNRIGHIAIGNDVTVRRKNEKALRQQADILDSVSEAVMVQDASGGQHTPILYWNGAAERLTGYSKEEAIGTSSFDLLKPEYDGSREDLRHTVIEEGKASYSGSSQRKDGSRIPVEVNIRATYDPDGKPSKPIAIVRDITEMKKAEESLRETTEYLENLFGYANAPIIVWEPSLKITRFNRAFERMTGYEAEEVIGKELGMLFPETTREESLRKIGLTSEGEQWESVEIPILRRDGDVRIALWNSANVYAADGTTMLATIAQGQDITERKHMEERLRRLNDELDGYAHMVSHDLKSPLSAISIANAMLREDIANIRDEQVRQEVAEALEAIDRSLTKTYELVNGLLSMAEAGQAPVETEHVSVFKIVSEILEERSAQIAEKHSHVQIEGDLGVIEGNALQIYQVFNNLIGNALVHNDANEPRIIIRSCVTDDSGAHRYEVCDNGSGIPSEEVEAVFKPFYKRGSGSENGIGLSIVKKVVELYGGSIRIVNRDGACFDFTLRDWEPGALLKEPPGSVGPAKITD